MPSSFPFHLAWRSCTCLWCSLASVPSPLDDRLHPTSPRRGLQVLTSQQTSDRSQGCRAFQTEAQLRLWGPLWLGVLRAGSIETWERALGPQTTSARLKVPNRNGRRTLRELTTPCREANLLLQIPCSARNRRRSPKPLPSDKDPLIAAKDCDASSLQPPCLHRGRLAF